MYVQQKGEIPLRRDFPKLLANAGSFCDMRKRQLNQISAEIREISSSR